MKRFALFCALSLVAAGVPASASILTFDISDQVNYNPITTYGTRINSLTDADGSYLMGNGFTPNVVASYRTVNPSDNATLTNQVDFWNTGYGDLVNVAFASSSGYLAEITLTPDPGYGVRLNSFDMAGWPTTDFPDQPLVIYDAAYNVLVDYSPIDVPGAGGTHVHITPDLTHFGTIHIQYSNDWNVGMDNVNFDQVPAFAAPEPSTFAAAASAIIAGLALRRRRRA